MGDATHDAVIPGSGLAGLCLALQRDDHVGPGLRWHRAPPFCRDRPPYRPPPYRPVFPVRQDLPSSQMLASCIGLLVEGKSDFEAIEGKRGEALV
ncbi:hypothetical protein ACO2Q2_12785 [Dyella sp. KRB-257]|uniref:hypothetical protein n=1 Tax=Dyella sp. KRB-257 TaxID=3400915 RepID=UPI003C0EACB2